jgi:methyltransferase (TIGR00027 family)
MQEGLPSITAMYVAFARGVSTYDTELSRICEDHFAEQLLPHGVGSVISIARSGSAAAAIFRGLREASLGFFDHLALRTRIIDDAVTKATTDGARQVVLLGAGLDARAHRLRCLQNSTGFEVDFPSTQELKRRKASALPLAARAVRYAACDFNDVTLQEALVAIGFNPAQPTIWVWEGVTMYLPSEAVEASVAAMAELSAADSTLIVTYVTPERAVFVPKLAPFMAGLLGVLAEPLRANFTPEAMAALLQKHGFDRTNDQLIHDAGARYGLRGARIAFATPAEHVAVTRRNRNRAVSSASSEEEKS